MMSRVTKRKKIVHAPVVEQRLVFPTDVPIDQTFVDISFAGEWARENDPTASIWGFYESPSPLYRVSHDKPRDSRWVLLRPGATK